MLIPDKFYRYYNDNYDPPIDMVLLALESNKFKVVMVDCQHFGGYYKVGQERTYDQNMLSVDIADGRLKRMEDET